MTLSWYLWFLLLSPGVQTYIRHPIYLVACHGDMSLLTLPLNSDIYQKQCYLDKTDGSMPLIFNNEIHNKYTNPAHRLLDFCKQMLWPLPHCHHTIWHAWCNVFSHLCWSLNENENENKKHTQRKKGTKTVPLGHYCYKWYPFFQRGTLFYLLFTSIWPSRGAHWLCYHLTL